MREAEIGLLAADQLDIDLGQDLGVEERAVLGAARLRQLSRSPRCVSA